LHAESVGAGSEVGHGHPKPPFVEALARASETVHAARAAETRTKEVLLKALRRSAGTPADHKGPGTYRATMPPPMRMPMPKPAQRASRSRKQVIVGFIGRFVSR